MHWVSLSLERFKVAFDVGRQENFWESSQQSCVECRRIKNCHLGSSQSLETIERMLSGSKQCQHLSGRTSGERLTRRGGPSGSPMLMTVCSCLERDVPTILQLEGRSWVQATDETKAA